MTLEELIHKWFISHKGVAGRLAKYAGKPAIFFQTAPADNQRRWKEQYPRIVYAIDMQANQERKSAGTMEISLLCDEAGTPPEEIEPQIKECLKDIVIKPDNGSPYCFAWSRTDSFEISSRESGTDTRIVGMEIRFDILEYTCQETTDPDPIMALCWYVKNLYPESIVIGLDKMKHITVASSKSPVIYCRLEAVEKMQETNMVVWMDGKIAVHILCPDSEVRMKMTAAIENAIALAGEVTMLDNSPMTIKRLQANYKADYLKEGQVSVTVHYGLLRYKAKPLILKNPYTLYDQKEEGR